MGGLLRLMSKNLAAFALLALALLLGNALAYGLCFYGTVAETGGPGSPNRMLDSLAGQVSPAGIGDGAARRLREEAIWALWLDSEGHTLWTLDAPEGLPERFTVQEVAAFAKGYLAGFPVFIRNTDEGMLVLGYPRDSYSKLTGNYLPLRFVRALPVFTLALLGVDLAALFLAYTLSRQRLIQEAGPIVEAVEGLGEGRPCALSETGALSTLAVSVNRVSRTLERQKRARAGWISGVSHDIRTPLSLMIGYAGRIAEDGTAPASVRREAERITAQGLRIRELVRDLNLANRLEYAGDPLAKTPVRPAELLRSFAARLLDGGLPEGYSLDLALAPEAEPVLVLADRRLLERALENLVQNSVRHNPPPCALCLKLALEGETAVFTVADSGSGLRRGQGPAEEVPGGEELGQAHGLGLTLVEQIAAAHGGALRLESPAEGGLRARLILPLEK